MQRAAPMCSSKDTLTRRIQSRLIRIIDALMEIVNSTIDLSTHTRSVTKTPRHSLSWLTIEIFWRVMISSAKSNSIWLKPLTTHALLSKEQILLSNIITIIWSNSTLGKISILSLKKKATASGSISSREKKSPAKSSFKLILPPKVRVSHAHLVKAENSQTRTHSYQIPLAECNSPWTLTKWLSNWSAQKSCPRLETTSVFSFALASPSTFFQALSVMSLLHSWSIELEANEFILI